MEAQFDMGAMMRPHFHELVPPILQHVAVERSIPVGAHVRRTGFSFVELVVVLMVMGIVAAIATPSFYLSLRHHELETAARRVKLDLEQARHAARMKSQSQSLTFTNATTYSLSSGVESLKNPGQTYTVDLSSTPYELDSVTINLGGPTTVSFDGYGDASVGGTIVLALGGETRTVTLNSTTGQITISDP